MTIASQFQTHVVHNQPQPLTGYNAWRTDPILQEAVSLQGGQWGASALDAYGAVTGGELMQLGELANRHRPELQRFDRYGRRLENVEFHPAYHETMRAAMSHQVHSFSWNNEGRPGAHVVRAALTYLHSQAEAGTGCPLTMTHAAIPALRHDTQVANAWEPLLLSTAYDSRPLPASGKTSCTIGMGMTEKQGGSDVRQNTTKAIKQSDGSYDLVGHKFFFSAPMCDAHLVLAQAEGGLSCFLLPRVLAEGELNNVHIQRLKNKLGDWSNASSEVEFLGANAHLVGKEGRGVATILQMVALTRLDCMVGSAAIMRQALVQAVHHVGQRGAFGRLLIDQPLMRAVLTDLALESEAATALAMRVAGAVDAATRDEREADFARVATAIGKYWICKRAPSFVNEAQECLGGIGYVEENILPRLYRQAPLNSIWEGSGNVQCLDVLRAFEKEPRTREALLRELKRAEGIHGLYDEAFKALGNDLQDTKIPQARSRAIVERSAVLLQAALMLRNSPSDVSDAFCRSRIGSDTHATFGCLAGPVPDSHLIDRCRVAQ